MRSKTAKAVIADWIAEELRRNQFFAISRMRKGIPAQKGKVNPAAIAKEKSRWNNDLTKCTTKLAR